MGRLKQTAPADFALAPPKQPPACADCGYTPSRDPRKNRCLVSAGDRLICDECLVPLIAAREAERKAKEMPRSYPPQLREILDGLKVRR